MAHANVNRFSGGHRDCSVSMMCNIASESLPPERPSKMRSPGSIISKSHTAAFTCRKSFWDGLKNLFLFGLVLSFFVGDDAVTTTASDISTVLCSSSSGTSSCTSRADTDG